MKESQTLFTEISNLREDLVNSQQQTRKAQLFAKTLQNSFAQLKLILKEQENKLELEDFNPAANKKSSSGQVLKKIANADKQQLRQI